MAILRAEALVKVFGGLRAVDGVDLALEKGEILGVIGPNGAGKTTLFSLIAGSQPPTSGRVFLEERLVSDRPAPPPGRGERGSRSAGPSAAPGR